MLHANALRSTIRGLRDAARSALSGGAATKAASLGMGAAGAAGHVAAELVEHSGLHYARDKALDGAAKYAAENANKTVFDKAREAASGEVIKRAASATRTRLGSPMLFGLRGAVRTTQVAAGVAAGTAEYLGKPVARAAHLGAELGAEAMRKGLHFDEEHGVHVSNWLGNRIAGGVAAGAVVMAAATAHNGRESLYERDPEDPSLTRLNRDPNNPELHGQALGAHGSLVTQGSKSARKRY